MDPNCINFEAELYYFDEGGRRESVVIAREKTYRSISDGKLRVKQPAL